MGRLLKDNDFDFVICPTANELTDRIAKGSGPVIVAEKSLDHDGWMELRGQLEAQPTWSDLPVMVCQSKEARPLSQSLLAKWRNVIALPRPLHIPSFCALLRAALESRRQQYSLRDVVCRLETVNESLEQRSALLRRLTVELATAEHNERRRIANDIHDHLAQLLVLSRMKLKLALKSPMDSVARTSIADIDNMLAESLQYTRNLVAELSPQVLQQAGLPAALKWLSEQMASHGLLNDTRMSVERLPLEHQRAAMVYQSVRELFFNIIKHAGVAQATLSVEVESDETLCITVCDQGKGFDLSLKREEIPTKFGLLTIRERIEALHGSFDAQSQIGEGTTITIRIPITPSSFSFGVPQPPSQATTFPPSNGPHVIRTLIVDDHTMMRQGLKTLLGGYSDIEIIGEAANGQEAVEKALQSRPDLIVMDVNMPLLNGVAATKEICTLLPKTKIIGLSYDMSTTRSMCDAGAVTCLDKAFAIEQLYQVISQVGGGSGNGVRDPSPALQ